MKYSIIAMLFTMASCTSDSDFKKVKSQLESQGYTNVRNKGYALFCCSKDDLYATSFIATSPSGERVEGCACSGLLKGMTIRFK